MRLIDADAMVVRLEEWNTSDLTDKALYNFTLNRILEQPTIMQNKDIDEWKIITDYCIKHNLVIITNEFFNFLQACYNSGRIKL